jgi:hypothetical protein
MIVVNVLRNQAFQMAFVYGDDVVEKISPTTSDPSLSDSVLPRTFK